MVSRLQLSVRFVHSFDEIIIALNGILLRKTLEFNARRYFSSASFHKNADVKLFLYLPRTTTFLPFLLSLRSTFVFRSRLGRTSRPEKWFGLNNTLCSRCLKNDRINGNVYRRCRGRACSNRWKWANYNKAETIVPVPVEPCTVLLLKLLAQIRSYSMKKKKNRKQSTGWMLSFLSKLYVDNSHDTIF